MVLESLKKYIREQNRKILVRKRVIKFQKKIQQLDKQNKKMRRKKLISFVKPLKC